MREGRGLRIPVPRSSREGCEHNAQRSDTHFGPNAYLARAGNGSHSSSTQPTQPHSQDDPRPHPELRALWRGSARWVPPQLRALCTRAASGKSLWPKAEVGLTRNHFLALFRAVELLPVHLPGPDAHLPKLRHTSSATHHDELPVRSLHAGVRAHAHPRAIRGTPS